MDILTELEAYQLSDASWHQADIALNLVKELDPSRPLGAMISEKLTATTNPSEPGALWIWTESNVFEFAQFPNTDAFDFMHTKDEFFGSRIWFEKVDPTSSSHTHVRVQVLSRHGLVLNIVARKSLRKKLFDLVKLVCS